VEEREAFDGEMIEAPADVMELFKKAELRRRQRRSRSMKPLLALRETKDVILV
jgi:hypothetical protein